MISERSLVYVDSKGRGAAEISPIADFVMINDPACIAGADNQSSPFNLQQVNGDT
jgi:hypothetical protein